MLAGSGNRCRILALALLAVTQAGAQAPAPPFRFMKELIPPGAGPVLGLADFDQDGDLDLLTNGTGIYLNDGNGNFTPHPMLSAVIANGGGMGYGATDAVAIGDLNGDGSPDVLSMDGAAASVKKWMNQGNGVLVGTFAQPPPPYVPGAFYARMALGDVDGDNDLDVVFSAVLTICGGWNCGTIPPLELWLNNGSATFTDASTQLPSQGMYAHQLALGDFDGDGDLDLLTSGDATISPGVYGIGPMLFLNNGAGTFAQTGIPISSPATFDAFAIGDLNLDGFPDLAMAASPRLYPGSCAPVAAPQVLLNLGNGSFAPLVSAITSAPECIPHLIDLNGDGVQDLLTLGYGSATGQLVIGGTLGPVFATLPIGVAPSYPPGFTQATSINHSAVGDLDGDGDVDLVAFTGQGNHILFNDSPGQPVAAVGALGAAWSIQGVTPNAADFDGDGDVDLVLPFADCFNGLTTTTSFRVALNDSTGTLAQAVPIPCSGCPLAAFSSWLQVLFDADQDGDADVFAIDSSGLVCDVLLNNGTAFVPGQSFALPGAATGSALRAGDLDGDGDLDVVVGMNGGPGAILLNNGSGTFQVASTFPTTNVNDIALVDLDGDSDLDIVANGSSFALLLNNGSGSFTPGGGAPPGAAGQVDAADIDGDGDVDLLVGIGVCINDGSGNFTVLTTITGTAGQPLALCDVDGDGLSDVLATGWVPSPGRWYRNLGAGGFAPSVNLPATLTIPIVHADFDRDGDEDLVAAGPRILFNTTRQLSRRMIARPGRPASLDLLGPPGGAWLLFASAGAGNLSMPPLGTAFLDLATTQLAGLGLFSPTGTATVSAITPTWPGIVGLSVYWQAVVAGPQGPRLTGLEITTVGRF